MVPWPTIFSPTGACGIGITNPVWPSLDPLNPAYLQVYLMSLPNNPLGAPPFEFDIQMLLIDFGQPVSFGVLPFLNMPSRVYRLSWDSR